MTRIAEEIMTKDLITVSMDQSVVEAYQLMQKHRIRHLPVQDASGLMIGILSERDVQRCIRYDRDPRSRLLDVELNIDPELKVGEAMSWPIHKVQGDVPVRDVAVRMLNEKMSSMIVECRKTGKRGIITTDDMLKLLIVMLDKEPGRLRLAVDAIVEDYLLA